MTPCPKLRLWITGISGFLGWHLGHYAQSQADIYGTYHRHPVSDPNFITASLDLTDPVALKNQFKQWQPDAVIHTAACSKPNQCQQNPELSYAINVTASVQLAECCAKAGIPLVFTSTEWVFDGRKAPYSETDIPAPINQYGKQKAEAEIRILEAHPRAVICRMPLMVGAKAAATGCFLQGWLKQLETGPDLSLFTDEIRSPISVESAAAGLLLALNHPGIGTLHLGGVDRLSRYELGQLIIQTWQLSDQYLHPCRQADVPMAAPRPVDVTMKSEKAYQLGYRPDPIKVALQKIKTDECR